MVDLTGLSLELMANTIVFVTQPFSLMRMVCMFGLRTLFLVTHLWLHLVKAIINFHADVCWKIMVWTFAIVSLPARILTALKRERLLEVHLYEMQVEIENLTWDKKQLEEQLQITIKDCRMMGTIISELEEENEKTVAQIELLEDELQDLKEENYRFTEVHGNGKCYFKALVDDEKEYNSCLLKTGGDENVVSRRRSDVIVKDSVYYRNREVAVSQSVFSALFSLVVGIIIWESEDDCIPLVVALFIVVGMSLRSVVHLFSIIDNRSAASEAVALLSFNWFVLGTLTYPTLPTLVHLLRPLLLRLVCWLGIGISSL